MGSPLFSMNGRRMVPTGALVLLLLCAGLSGCLGGDDDEKKPSKVHLVWGADATSGTVMHTMVPGSQNTTADLVEVEFTFDFNETYSEEGEMATFYVDPGNGDPAVEVSASDMSSVTVSYDGHGIYRVILGANDTEGNTATTEVLVRVEYELHYDNSAESDPYPIWFDCAPGSVEASPKRVDLLSNVSNPPGFFITGGPSTVTWSMRDPGDTEGNTATTEVLVRVEYELHYDNSNEEDPYPIWFDCAPGSVEASPKRVELLSNVTNPDDGIIIINPGESSTVTWSVRDPGDTEVDAKQSEIPDGGEDQYGWGTNSPLAGGWRLDIDVDGDNVDTETTIWIEYETMETPVPEPPVAE